MAHDAYALSPISARAAQPAETDYEAICDAFMETSRGRWFLAEYAKRNRNADTRAVLDAVARIETALVARESGVPLVAPALRDEILSALAEARCTILDALDAAQTISDPREVRRAGQMVQGVAWTLRESGADPRICNILDKQAKVIAAGCPRPDAIIDQREAIILGLDALDAQIMRALSPAPEDFAAKQPAEAPPEPEIPEPESQKPTADAEVAPAATTAAPAAPVSHDDATAAISSQDAPPADNDIVMEGTADQILDHAAETPAPTSIPAEPASPPKQVSGPTLGEAILHATPRSDPFALLRKMTPVELVALFT